MSNQNESLSDDYENDEFDTMNSPHDGNTQRKKAAKIQAKT